MDCTILAGRGAWHKVLHGGIHSHSGQLNHSGQGAACEWHNSGCRIPAHRCLSSGCRSPTCRCCHGGWQCPGRWLSCARGRIFLSSKIAVAGREAPMPSRAAISGGHPALSQATGPDHAAAAPRSCAAPPHTTMLAEHPMTITQLHVSPGTSLPLLTPNAHARSAQPVVPQLLTPLITMETPGLPLPGANWTGCEAAPTALPLLPKPTCCCSSGVRPKGMCPDIKAMSHLECTGTRKYQPHAVRPCGPHSRCCTTKPAAKASTA